MLKKEIILELKKNNIELSESQFRRYIQFGLIPATKCGNGKGKGVTSIYPSNTIEVIKEIQKGRLVGFTTKDMIYYLFMKGYLVDFEKLKQRLLIDVELMLQGFNFLLEKTSDLDTREWIVEEIATENLPNHQPGRPSNEKLSRLNDKKENEEDKIRSVLKFIEEIFSPGEVCLNTIQSFTLLYGYTPKDPNIYFTKKWFDPEKWLNFIGDCEKEDLVEVQITLILLGMYQRFFQEHKINSLFFQSYIEPAAQFYQNAGLKNFLKDPLLIKLAIIFLTTEPFWRKGINNILSWNSLMNNYDVLKQEFPKLLYELDMHLKGGVRE